jgi:hypothetical protein
LPVITTSICPAWLNSIPARSPILLLSTSTPHGSENSLYAGHWMFTSGKGLTAEGLYKTDMLTAPQAA